MDDSNDTEAPEPPLRIPAKGGDEEDVFSGWRRVLCYTQRPGVTKKIKRKYNRRLRAITRQALRK